MRHAREADRDRQPPAGVRPAGEGCLFGAWRGPVWGRKGFPGSRAGRTMCRKLRRRLAWGISSTVGPPVSPLRYCGFVGGIRTLVSIEPGVQAQSTPAKELCENVLFPNITVRPPGRTPRTSGRFGSPPAGRPNKARKLARNPLLSIARGTRKELLPPVHFRVCGPRGFSKPHPEKVPEPLTFLLREEALQGTGLIPQPPDAPSG